MAGSDDETTPPGWYRQQDDPTTLRWWDGDDWTEDTMPAPAADRSPRRAPTETPGARPPRREPLAPTQEDDWAAGAWAKGARPTEAPRPAVATPSPEATRKAGPVAADPRRVARPATTPAGDPRRATPARPGQPVRTPGAARQPTRPTDRPRPDRRPPERRPPERRPPERRPERRPSDRTASARSGRGPARPPRSGTRRDEKVVQRGGTPPPVVRVVLRAALIAVLLGVGYLGYTQIRDAEPERARTVSESERPTPTVDSDAPRLAKVVLALNDLPRGWTAQAVGTEPDDVCDGRVPLSVIEPLESTKAAFTMGEAGPFITNIVSTFADDDEAQAFLDLTARTVESCRTYEIEGDTKVELGPLEFPNFGDSSFAAEAIGTSPYGDLAGDLIYVRVGARVTSLETIAFGDSTLSPELVEHLTRLVANRME